MDIFCLLRDSLVILKPNLGQVFLDSDELLSTIEESYSLLFPHCPFSIAVERHQYIVLFGNLVFNCHFLVVRNFGVHGADKLHGFDNFFHLSDGILVRKS
jgi:hypothetical protein